MPQSKRNLVHPKINQPIQFIDERKEELKKKLHQKMKERRVYQNDPTNFEMTMDGRDVGICFDNMIKSGLSYKQIINQQIINQLEYISLGVPEEKYIGIPSR